MLTYQSNAWNELENYTSSHIKKDSVTGIMNSATEHYISSSNDHCLIIPDVDIDLPDGIAFHNMVWDYVTNYLTSGRSYIHHKLIYHTDNTEHTLGTWVNNPFKTKTQKKFTVGASFPIFTGSFLGGNPVGKATVVSPAKKTPVAPAINNHMCVVCNRWCTKTDKSCWYCGSPIKP
jgi:hypothetical protein